MRAGPHAHDESPSLDSVAQAGPCLDVGGNVGERESQLGRQGFVEHDRRGKGAGQFLEQGGPECVPDGDGLWREVPWACKSVTLRAPAEVCEAGPETWPGRNCEGRDGRKDGSSAVCLCPGSDVV